MVFGFGRKQSRINPAEAVRRRESISLKQAQLKKIRDDRKERDEERKLRSDLRSERFRPVKQALSKVSSGAKKIRGRSTGVRASPTKKGIGASWGGGFPSVGSSDSPFTRSPVRKR